MKKNKKTGLLTKILIGVFAFIWVFSIAGLIISGYFTSFSSSVELFLGLNESSLRITSIYFLISSTFLLIFTFLFDDLKKKYID